jgi:signal transduction histidine kinase
MSSMQPTTASAGARETEVSHPLWPQWHRIYFLLAAFDVLIVALSLYLNHRIIHIYTDAVEVNQAWVEILHDTFELGHLAAAVNAPGNDVFETRRVEAEAAKLRAARGRYQDGLATLRSKLETRADGGPTRQLLDDLDAVEAAMAEMTGEAEGIFAAFRADRPEEAGKHMAAMDRKHDLLHAGLNRLRERVGAIQTEHFREQTAAAAGLQQYALVIAGFIFLMVGAAALYGYQISERKRSAEARSRLLEQVMAAQEEERRRIARDLHDEIGQSLTSLLVGLRNLGAAPTPEAAGAQAEDLRAVAAATLDEVRRLARGLRPMALDDLGLPAALERHVADFAQAHGLAVRLDTPGLGESRLPEAVETGLYRIVQEALTNVGKHAAACNVRVVVERQPGGVQALVEDDGRGFDADPRQPPGDGLHLGLSGMYERAALLGGTVGVSSRRGGGTRVVVRIPLAEGPHGQDPSPDRR